LDFYSASSLKQHSVAYEKRKLTQTRLCKYNMFNNFKYSL